MTEKTESNYPSLPDESAIGATLHGSKPLGSYKLYGNPQLGKVPLRLPKSAAVPMLKEDDPESLRPQSAMEAYARVFHLKDIEQLENYNKVIRYVAHGKAQISHEKIEWCDDDKNFVVFLRWCEMFLDVPTPGVGEIGGVM